MFIHVVFFLYDLTNIHIHFHRNQEKAYKDRVLYLDKMSLYPPDCLMVTDLIDEEIGFGPDGIFANIAIGAEYTLPTEHKDYGLQEHDGKLMIKESDNTVNYLIQEQTLPVGVENGMEYGIQDKEYNIMHVGEEKVEYMMPEVDDDFTILVVNQEKTNEMYKMKENNNISENIHQPHPNNRHVKDKRNDKKTMRKPRKCDICELEFISSTGLRAHKITHGEEKVKCDICNAVFCWESNLIRHRRYMHTGERPYECEICNARFSESGNLTRHKKIHIEKKPYECDICGSKHREKYNLYRHKKTHDESILNKTECVALEEEGIEDIEGCPAEEGVSGGGGRFKCELCSTSFNWESNLDKHRRSMHDGEQPYRCEVCKATFYEASSLRRHKSIHANIKIKTKPYKCDICGSKHRQKVNLEKHRKTHEKVIIKCI